MKQLLNILLIITIVTCPFRCQLVGCKACAPFAKLGEVESCCCEKSQSEQELPTLPACPEKNCHCQCLCSGAVLPDVFQVDEIIESTLICSFEPLFGFRLTSETLIHCRGPDLAPPLNGPNVGRTIRCLHSSLTI